MDFTNHKSQKKQGHRVKKITQACTKTVYDNEWNDEMKFGSVRVLILNQIYPW